MKTQTTPIPLLPVGHAPDLPIMRPIKLFTDHHDSPLIYVEQLTQATDMKPPFFMGRVRGVFGGLLDEVHGSGVADVILHARHRFIRR